MTPRNWEVWLVNMPYDEGIGAKVRPALVIDARTQAVLTAKMTSHAPRSGYPYEYAMLDWGGAGLRFQTTVRLSKTVTLQPGAFLKRLGAIQPIDQVNIWNILMNMAAAYHTT